MIGAGFAVVRRPGLWWTAVRQLRRIARPGWREYVRFRMLTQYGEADARPAARDVVAYLEWCKQWHRYGG